MNYTKISDLEEIIGSELNGGEDVLLTKMGNSKKLKLSNLSEYITKNLNLTEIESNIQDINTELDAKATTTDLSNGLESKVDKIPGKVLSSEDYATVDKVKLDGIETNANKYVLPVASETVLGGVKAGANISITPEGVISAERNISTSWDSITGTPDSLSGYGITDAYTKSEVDSELDAKVNLDSPIFTGTVTGSFSGDITGNATSASTLETSRNISLTGDASGSASFDGSADASITVTIADNSHAHTITNVTGLQSTLDAKVDDSEKGSANGVATLDVNGKVVLTQIPDSVLGQLEYQGVWNFTTLPTATQKGQYWIASVSGNGYVVGDWAVWNGLSFDKVDNTDAVASVAGRTGNVVLTKSDVGLANVDNTADSSKNVLSATKLTTARTINGVSFNGTTNITITDSTKLPVGGKAADSELLDGIDSSEFMRKSVYNVVTGGTLYTHNNQTINANSYQQGAIKLHTTDGSAPILGFHTGGATAVALYERDGNLNTINAAGADGVIVTTANTNFTPGAIPNSVVQRSSDGNIAVNRISVTDTTGEGANILVGDAAYIGDVNISDTIRITGAQNAAAGYIQFGNADGKSLGKAGNGDLTWNNSKIVTEEIGVAKESGRLTLIEYSDANSVAGYPHAIRFTNSTINTPLAANFFEGYTTTATGYQVMTVSLVGAGGPTQYPRTWTRANRASGWTPWAEVLTTVSGKAVDSDKLDGIDGTLYLQSKNLGSGSLINTIGSGIYRYDASPDSPTDGYGTLLSVRGSNGGTGLADTLGQIVFDYDFNPSSIFGNSKNHYIRGAEATTDSGNPNGAANSPFDLLYTNQNLGYLLGFTFLSRYASTSHLNGSSDATEVIQNALNNNKVVYIDIGSTPYINGVLQMPQGTKLSCLAPATLRGHTQLRIGPSGVINPNAYCVIENLGISKMASQYVFNEVAGLSSGGVAIQTTNFNNAIVNVQILNNIITGFNLGIDILNGGDLVNNTRGRWIISGNKFDNNGDIRLGYCLDTMYLSENHSWPFLGSSVTTGAGTPRAYFIRVDNNLVDWLQVTNCFSHSNLAMISGYFSGVCIGGGYDYEDYSISAPSILGATKVGINIQNGSSKDRGLAQIIGTRFNGGEVHIRAVFDSSNNDIARAMVTGVTCIGATHTFFSALDTNASAQGGGILTISADCANIGGIATTKFIGTAGGTAKINIIGITRPGTVTQSAYYTDPTAVIQVNNEMTY